MKEKQNKQEKKEEKKILVGTRGRIFEGIVTRQFPGRVTIELERTVYIPKYERFLKKKTRLHARLPKELSVEIGDSVKIQECRPLSKTIHFVVIEKVQRGERK